MHQFQYMLCQFLLCSSVLWLSLMREFKLKVSCINTEQENWQLWCEIFIDLFSLVSLITVQYHVSDQLKMLLKQTQSLDINVPNNLLRECVLSLYHC